MSRLKKHYTETLQAQLQQTLGLSNPMQVPRIEKITVNMGVGDAVSDKKLLENAVADLTKLTGQKPQTTKARKAIASFKLREGLAIGARVTLRGDRMYEFLTASSRSRCPASATSVVSARVPSTAAVTTTSA